VSGRQGSNDGRGTGHQTLSVWLPEHIAVDQCQHCQVVCANYIHSSDRFSGHLQLTPPTANLCPVTATNCPLLSEVSKKGRLGLSGGGKAENCGTWLWSPPPTYSQLQTNDLPYYFTYVIFNRLQSIATTTSQNGSSEKPHGLQPSRALAHPISESDSDSLTPSIYAGLLDPRIRAWS